MPDPTDCSEPEWGRIRVAQRITGLCDREIYARSKYDPEFPEPVRHSGSGYRYWNVGELRAYMASRSRMP